MLSCILLKMNDFCFKPVKVTGWLVIYCKYTKHILNFKLASALERNYSVSKRRVFDFF